jgi:hypothetical protein
MFCVLIIMVVIIFAGKYLNLMYKNLGVVKNLDATKILNKVNRWQR